MVLPSKRGDVLSRRKNARINFWDLAQVNIGTAEAPVYQDHGILKVPGYTITAWPFNGALYTIDPFTATDYADYTQKMFDVGPVTEWKHLFKKMAYDPDETRDLRVRYAPQTGLINTLPLDTVTSASDLTTYGMQWTASGLKYRGFTELTFQHLTTLHNWFSGSTQRKTIYYVTAAYDPLAPDVSDLAISGNIEVYLMPHITLFMGASYNGGHVSSIQDYDGVNGVQVLGPWYQVIPRANYDFAGVGFNGADNDAYLDYQKNRTDAIASEWMVTGLGTISSTTLDPLTFANGNFTYRLEGGDNDMSAVFYNYTASVLAHSSGVSSANLWENDQPFLMAVMKAHGQFYYVWSLVSGGSERAAGESASYISRRVINVPPGDRIP
jgi:hypothetical protein